MKEGIAATRAIKPGDDSVAMTAAGRIEPAAVRGRTDAPAER
jgi:hypothetical protein